MNTATQHPGATRETQEPPAGEFLTKEEVATRLKVTIRTVENWLHHGLLPHLRVANTLRFYWPDVVEQLRRHCAFHADGTARVRWGEMKAKAARAESGSQRSEGRHG